MSDRREDERALVAALNDIQTAHAEGTPEGVRAAYRRAWDAGLDIQPAGSDWTERERVAALAAVLDANDYSAVAAAVLEKLDHEISERTNGAVK